MTKERAIEILQWIAENDSSQLGSYRSLPAECEFRVVLPVRDRHYLGAGVKIGNAMKKIAAVEVSKPGSYHCEDIYLVWEDGETLHTRYVSSRIRVYHDKGLKIVARGPYDSQIVITTGDGGGVAHHLFKLREDGFPGDKIQ